jgi:hypothetical protein
LGPIDVALPLAVTSVDSSLAPTEAEKATRFIERIQHIHQQVQDILQKSNDKYKQHHDQHQVPHKFVMGDKVWLHLQKERLIWNPIGSFTHSVMGRTPSPRLWVIMLLSSTFLLSLACTQCSMWISFDLISHHYWTPHNNRTTDTNKAQPDCIQQESSDKIVEKQVKGTRQQMIQLYQVVKAGQLLHQGKWLTRGQIQQKFPHLMGALNTMETISS